MERKHTPGPWAYASPGFDAFGHMAHSFENDPEEYRIERIAVYQNDGSTAQGSQVIALDHDPDDGIDLIADRAEHEANLRLISAAPELLQACKDLLAQIVQTSAFDDASRGEDPGLAVDVAAAQKIIAKATGQAVQS